MKEYSISNVPAVRLSGNTPVPAREWENGVYVGDIL